MWVPDALPVEIGRACRIRLGEFPDFSDTVHKGRARASGVEIEDNKKAPHESGAT